MARALIIANGEIRDYDWHRNQILPGDYIICADGGANHARILGVTPDLVVGDMDSINPELAVDLAAQGCEFVRYPRDKDETDTGLAVQYALARSGNPVIIMGGIGPRLDHTLANVSLLAAYAGKANLVLINEFTQLRVGGGSMVVDGRPGDQISLLPLTEEVSGITTAGLKWSLQNAVFRLGNPYGVSNELVGKEARITWERGLLMVIKARDTSRD